MMTEQNKDESFMKDWEINVQNKSALHKSGLGFTCQHINEDGSLRVEVENLIPWEQKMFAQYHDFEKVDEDLLRLRNEFAQIYKEKMQIKENNIDVTMLNAVRNNNFSSR